MSTIHFERLDAAITHGFEYPEEFDMQHWFGRVDCGTTACLAGTTAHQAGWRPVFKDQFSSTSTVTRNGRTAHVSLIAASLLGLNDDQADIFGAENLGEVIELRNEWAREAGVPERTWGSP